MGLYSEPTLKRLFGLSMNVCAFRIDDEPACEERLIDADWKSVKARICHIRAQNKKGPRYDPDMTNAERYGFDNLILLCPNHHARIDDLEPDRFTVEELTRMKWEAVTAAGSDNAWERDNATLIDRAVDRLIAVMDRENSIEPLQPASMQNPTAIHLEWSEPRPAVMGEANVGLGGVDVRAQASVSVGGDPVSDDVVSESGVESTFSANLGGPYDEVTTVGGPGASVEHEVVRGAHDEIVVDDSAGTPHGGRHASDESLNKDYVQRATDQELPHGSYRGLRLQPPTRSPIGVVRWQHRPVSKTGKRRFDSIHLSQWSVRGSQSTVEQIAGPKKTFCKAVRKSGVSEIP